MNELEFSEIVRVTCKHPRLRTPHGTFAEVILFLEGFALGAGLAGRNGPYHAPFTTPFMKWQGIDLTELGDVWEIWIRQYPDEATALHELPMLYRRYAESVCPPASPANSRDL